MVPLNMQTLRTGFKLGWKQLIKMAPTLGVIFGVGLMTAATVKTGFETPKLRDELEELEDEEDISHDEYLKAKFRIFLYHLGLPALMLVSGGAMIFGGYKIKYTQAAIATAALASQTEEAEKLEKKFIEKYGKREYEKMQDEITKEDVMSHPIDFATVINTGHGNMLCWDPIIHDYYWSDLDYIRKQAENANREMTRTRWGMHNSAMNYNTWREYLDLPACNEHFQEDRPVTNVDLGKDLGWFNNPIELKFTVILLPNDIHVHVIGFTKAGSPKWRLNIEDENGDDASNPFYNGDDDETDMKYR